MRNPIVCSADYSDDTRLARLQHRTSVYRLSIPRVRLIALNQISSADISRVGQICMCRRVYAHSRSGRKGFYRYEFNFHTNSSGRSFSLYLCSNNTRRTECYVPMQTWFAGYLERNRGGEHSNTAPYPGWLSVIQ